MVTYRTIGGINRRINPAPTTPEHHHRRSAIYRAMVIYRAIAASIAG